MGCYLRLGETLMLMLIPFFTGLGAASLWAKARDAGFIGFVTYLVFFVLCFDYIFVFLFTLKFS
jgi:hypothetical protein